MSRGRRTRLEDGIYADASGIAAVVKVRGVSKEKRFPPGHPRDQIRAWRSETRAKLEKSTDSEKRQRADPRSLLRSIAAYLRKRQGRPGYKSDRSHLKAWIPKLGPKRRHQITTDDCESVIAHWRAAGKSETTIRHRVRVLRELYQALDGPDVAHPLKGLTLPKMTRPAPVPVSQALIQKVAQSLLTGKRHAKGYGSDPVKSRAWFLVYATCGQRPAQIRRAEQADVDLERRIWFVRPAKGGDPIPLPLNDDMVQAWEVFIKAEAWGGFDTSSFAKLLRRHGWPKGIRPYTLRHTFAIDLLLSGVPLADIQGLLGHARIQTTREFYAPIQLALLQSAVMKRSLHLPTVPPSATHAVPSTARPRRHIAPQFGIVRPRLRYTTKGVSTRKRP
jgi:integrase